MTAAAIMDTERYNGERKKTNVSALYFCIGFVMILFAFMGCSFSKSNISQFISGYDNCGNICGAKNDWNILSHCGSNDKTDDKLELVNVTAHKITLEDINDESFDPDDIDISKECVATCDVYLGYTQVANRCVQLDRLKNLRRLQSFAAHIKEMWHIILIGFGVALTFSYITLVLFRYAVQHIVWGLIAAFISLLTLVALFFLATVLDDVSLNSFDDPDFSKKLLLFAAALFAILAVVTGLVAYYFRKHIALVVQLFKETAKALNDIPLIIAEPLLTFVALFISFIVFLYFVIVIDSSGDLTVKTNEHGGFMFADYKLGAVMKTAHIVNVIAFCWFSQFLIGCQQFVIASTISDWYFARNKDKIESPIVRGFSNLVNFHLGSICFGSIVFTAIYIVRVLFDGFKGVFRQRTAALARLFSPCFGSFLETIQQFIQYLARNAYIVVAKDGTPLFASGKRAFHLLKENLIDVIALNKVGDIILALGKIFVVAITGFVTYEMMDDKLPSSATRPVVALICIFAYLIIHCFLTVFEMTVDTIFLCFCEDCEQNNGSDRPYFMSQDLKVVMQELNKSGGDVIASGRRDNETGDGQLIPPAKNLEV